jgi:hypothetical protein
MQVSHAGVAQQLGPLSAQSRSFRRASTVVVEDELDVS